MGKMNDRLLFYAGLKEKVERTQDSHQDYLTEGYTIDNHFAFGLYDFRGLLEQLYEQGNFSKLADYFELFGTANRSLYRDHSKHFWWIYPPLVWLLCSLFYRYRSGESVYAANLARFNYHYMEELKGDLSYGFSNIPIGYTELGMFEELMGYFSLLFQPSRFENHMQEAKRLIEYHKKLQHEGYSHMDNNDAEIQMDPGGINEDTIVAEYCYGEAHGPFNSALFLCFDINERTFRFEERVQIFDRLKVFFIKQPDWKAMNKPSLSNGHFHFMSPEQ